MVQAQLFMFAVAVNKSQATSGTANEQLMCFGRSIEFIQPPPQCCTTRCADRVKTYICIHMYTADCRLSKRTTNCKNRPRPRHLNQESKQASMLNQLGNWNQPTIHFEKLLWNCSCFFHSSVVHPLNYHNAEAASTESKFAVRAFSFYKKKVEWELVKSPVSALASTIGSGVDVRRSLWHTSIKDNFSFKWSVPTYLMLAVGCLHQENLRPEN